MLLLMCMSYEKKPSEQDRHLGLSLFYKYTFKQPKSMQTCILGFRVQNFRIYTGGWGAVEEGSVLYLKFYTLIRKSVFRYKSNRKQKFLMKSLNKCT